MYPEVFPEFRSLIFSCKSLSMQLFYGLIGKGSPHRLSNSIWRFAATAKKKHQNPKEYHFMINLIV